MGLLANLKLLWNNRKKIKVVTAEVDQIKETYMKSGWKTTEFWMTVLTMLTTLAETFKGNIDPKWAAIISAGLSFGYAIARGLTKSTASKTATENK